MAKVVQVLIFMLTCKLMQSCIKPSFSTVIVFKNAPVCTINDNKSYQATMALCKCIVRVQHYYKDCSCTYRALLLENNRISGCAVHG